MGGLRRAADGGRAGPACEDGHLTELQAGTSMNKLLTGALAVALAASLAACSKAVDAGASPGGSGSPSSVASTTSTTSGAGTPSDTMSSGSLPDDGSTSGSGPVTPPPVDQTTPEAAMSSWLGAMVAGDGNTVCALMATQGKTITSIPGAASACGTKITPMLAQIKELGAAFQGLKISGATVTGDTASFESVTTEPALAADVVASFKAVKIGGKWYVTQG
jgi:hypothetical protein